MLRLGHSSRRPAYAFFEGLESKVSRAGGSKTSLDPLIHSFGSWRSEMEVLSELSSVPGRESVLSLFGGF